MLLGELRGEQKEHEERNDVKWNRLNEKLYVRLLDVNAKRRKENRIYEFILSFIYFQCALRHINILNLKIKTVFIKSLISPFSISCSVDVLSQLNLVTSIKSRHFA